LGTAYKVLFRSLMTWYARWYQDRRSQRLYACLALTACEYINLWSLGAIADFFGFDEFIELVASNVVNATVLAILLFSLNWSFGKRFVGVDAPASAIGLVSKRTKVPAIVYVTSTFGLFGLILAMMWNKMA